MNFIYIKLFQTGSALDGWNIVRTKVNKIME